METEILWSPQSVCGVQPAVGIEDLTLGETPRQVQRNEQIVFLRIQTLAEYMHDTEHCSASFGVQPVDELRNCFAE